MTNGSHPPKKPSPTPSKKEKGLKPRRIKPNAQARGRLVLLMSGNV
jgi:hypothetical protein